jgi:hypothetical protein
MRVDNDFVFRLWEMARGTSRRLALGNFGHPDGLEALIIDESGRTVFSDVLLSEGCVYERVQDWAASLRRVGWRFCAENAE